ncbi:MULTISPECIES: glycoside hydrolase family 3 protein [unclassified Streptomyces]|uniref:glycoside hydrolase family 3 protein n=1 Tax=unclassified Streptomyces TaxID=2593676 RepID=UPI000F6B8980|nr:MULTISPECIES: glycoside hydrolase family 3 N-terminal domain-containing protein [unclassified Streptomyces]AZM59497.1 sugar hydrolase [Streptomyces sp. WAC 01438]RSM95737.1 sugar hydrolase [Streptomyces sp. WAC 01420]
MAQRSRPRLLRWAHSVLQPGFEGTAVPGWVRRRISEGLSSVVLFGRNIQGPEQVAGLTTALYAENPDLVIAVDEEAGDVTRLEARTGASRPGSLALGTLDDIDVTEQVARDVGRELHAAGITLNYAPSADVNTNPLNPVIGVRSFGARPDVVSRHAAAWVRGLQSAGVAASAKHFPGHGDTVVDSHHGLPRVASDAGTLALTALPPFIAAMDAGARAVMTAHLLVPAYDDRWPATLSRFVVEDLLRGELGFTGLVVTDAVEMGAVADRYGMPDATVRAVAAGADAVCVGSENAGEATVARLADALVDAVLTGALPEQRLAEAADRVREFAQWAGTLRRTAPDAGGTPGIGLTVARRAVRVHHRPDRDTAFPLVDAPHVVELTPAPTRAIDPTTPWGVAEPLKTLRPGTTSVRIGEHRLQDGEEVLDRLALRPAHGRPLVVVVRDAARYPWMTRALACLVRRRPDALVVEMGVPTGERPGAVYLATHGAARVSGIAAAEVLVGRSGP